MLYVGIDVAKYKLDISVINSDGNTFIKHLQITNNREGFTKIQFTLTNLQKTTGEEIQIALEDTGHYCFNLLRFLRTNGYPTLSYNPLLIKNLRNTILFVKQKPIRRTQ